MTKEEKIIKRQERSFRRKNKRFLKDEEYLHIAILNDKYSISWGRRKKQGRVYSCEMGWSSCEERDYCNGDC
jgi:hypothetical protein